MIDEWSKMHGLIFLKTLCYLYYNASRPIQGGPKK